MVSKDNIEKIINKSIDIVNKCRTLSQIQSGLAEYSRDEKRKLLEKKLTPLEWEDYNNIYDEFKEDLDGLNEHLINKDIPEDKVDMIKDFIEEINEDLDEMLFKYERRIFEDYTIPSNPIPIIDESIYVHDESVPLGSRDDEDYYVKMYSQDRVNPIEARQIELQEKNVSLTDSEHLWISSYFLDNYTYLTRRINHDTEGLGDFLDPYEIEDLERKLPLIKKHMDNAINKTDGLIEPTILYYSGRVDKSLVPGMHGVWKSYTSTSFQESTMDTYNDENPTDWSIIIYAPKGVRGICGNGRSNPDKPRLASSDNLNQYTWEHEYLLGRNTGYTVVDIDYENHRQVVLLDEP